MSRSGLEIDRDTGNIIREGCGSCVVKVWHETNSHTGAGHFTDPTRSEQPKKKKKKTDSIREDGQAKKQVKL